MSLPAARYQRSAWLFIQGESSVTMTVLDEDEGFTLVVRGPEASGASYRFTDMNALMTFAEAQEQKLLEAGFQLQAFAERRSGAERRREPRPGTQERRRSPIG
jgi:hypothetical protein